MEALVIVSSIVGMVGSNYIYYRLGYKKGARSVLNEWKDWLNDEYLGG